VGSSSSERGTVRVATRGGGSAASACTRATSASARKRAAALPQHTSCSLTATESAGGPHKHRGEVRDIHAQQPWLWQEGTEKGKIVTDIVLRSLRRRTYSNVLPIQTLVFDAVNALASLTLENFCQRWRPRLQSFKAGLQRNLRFWPFLAMLQGDGGGVPLRQASALYSAFIGKYSPHRPRHSVFI